MVRSARPRDAGARMSLWDHLKELRKRAFRSALAVVVGAVVGWFAGDFVWAQLRHPVELIALAGSRDAVINFPTITGAFDLRMQMAVTVGIVISSPVWLYQVFAFLVPGLSRRERRYTLGFLGTAIPLFLGGCAAGWFVVPHIVEIMTSFVAQQDASFIDARGYFDFVLKLILVTGVAFVLPVFLVLLNFMGILEGRTILRSWRWAIVAITTFTAIATPAADVLSMFLLAIPMVLLYLGACLVAIAHDRLAARRVARELGDLPTRALRGH